MKPVKIRVCYIQGVKTVEIIQGRIAYLVTAKEPRLLMRNARKLAKTYGFTITGIETV